MQSTALLNELQARRQFILYRLEPGENGKLDKVPCSPQGYRIDGQDPAHWMLPHEALLWAQTLGPPYSVGIVIYDGCGLACIDFDHCRDPSGGWQPHVAAFVSRFPGASLETSVSGAGRHLFVSYRPGALPAHSTKNRLYRIEAYTKARFIALTGFEVSGSVLGDHTIALTAFLTEYFPPKGPDDDRDGLWTSTPVSAWRGPMDDRELLQRALRAYGIKSRLGTGAAFVDLWYAQVEVLSRAFPSPSGQPWDGSSADQALANHLAFWTGNDCERMVRMMRGSALARPKWDRPDYLPRTILEACSKQTEWYTEPTLAHDSETSKEGSAPGVSDQGVGGSDSVQPIPSIAAPAVPLPPADMASPALSVIPPPPLPTKIATLQPSEIPAPGAFLTISMMKQVFAGYCYVKDIHQIQHPDGSSSAKDRFDALYGGRQWAMTVDGQKPGKSAWDAYLNNELHEFDRAETQCFLPNEPTGLIRWNEGRREINCYKSADIRRVQGDPSPLILHLQKLLPHDWELMLYTMAGRVQFIGTKFTWAPFLQGTKGNGKTLLGKILEYAIGPRYVHWPKSDQVDEKFNSVFTTKLLLIVDELPKNGYDIEPVLNTLVTATRLETRPMYAEKIMKDVCFNLWFISNYQGSLQCDPDQRRYAPFFCAQQHKKDLLRDGLTPEYFIRFRQWLETDGYAICAEYLRTLQIPEHLTPTHAVRAPETSSTHIAYAASRGPAEQEIYHAIEQRVEGFRNGWINSNAVDMLLVRVGKDKVIPRNAREALIESAGYVPHPSLSGGLCDIALPDGTRPRLYISEGHPWAVDYLTTQQVKDGYLAAQKV